jgi:hypothetical protein
MNYENSASYQAQQNLQAAANGSAMGLAGIRQNTIETIRNDIKSRLDCLLKTCEGFERAQAEHQLRLTEIKQLRSVLEVLDRPLAMPPEAGR